MITDFIEDRRLLVLGGERFLMRHVPFSAVVRAFSRISEATMRELASGADLDALRVLESFRLPQLAEMLSWVLEPPDQVRILAALKEEGRPALERAAVLLMDINDMPRIFESLGKFSAPASGNGKNDSKKRPGGLELLLDTVARRYGSPPHEVAEWPYEEVLGALAICEYEAELAAPLLEQAAGRAPRRMVVQREDPVHDSLISWLGGERGGKTH